MGIWLKGLSDRKNTMACFRYKVKKTCKRVYVKIAAAGSYKVVINGRFIGYGPRRTSIGNTVLNEYDISDYVKSGDVWLVAEVVYHGTDSFYIVDEQPFFTCGIYEDGVLVADEESFEAYLNLSKRQKVRRYSWQRGFLESYSYEKDPALNYTGKIFGWQRFETEKVSGNKIVEKKLPYPVLRETTFVKVEEGGVIRKENAEIVNCGRSSAYDELSVSFAEETLESDAVAELSGYALDVRSDSTDRFYTYVLKGNKTGFFNIDMEVFGDCKVFCVFDETCNYEKTLHHTVPKEEAEKIFDEHYLNGTLPVHFARMSTLNIVEYSLKKGGYCLSCFEPYTMKYLRIIVVGAKARIDKTGLVLYENESVYSYKYDVSEKRRNSVFRAAQSTLAQNAVDILTDCPSRERGGWLCDSYFSARAEYLLTGENLIEKNFLESFLDSFGRKDLPKGVFPMVYPSDHYSGKFIPNWDMFLILELEDYKKRTGDENLVEKFRNKAFTLYKYFTGFENEYGLLEDFDSWVFVEWSKSNEYTDGVNFPTNMLYYEYLRTMYRLYGDESLIKKAEMVRKRVNELSFNGEFYEDNAVRENGKLVLKGHITETCQYYAFYFGVANEAERKGLYDRLFYEFCDRKKRNGLFGYVARSNMFIGDILRLDYLYKTGKIEKAVEECLDIFYPMAQKTGTLWEFEGATASCCHAFAAVCVSWLIAEQKKAGDIVKCKN